MKKICIYTCITGDYDDLKELKQTEVGIDYFCFTNNDKIKSNTWNVVYIEDNTLNNHMLSRKIKMLGHPMINQYDICVWIDANVVIRSSILDFLNQGCDLEQYDFVAFQHEERNCIYEEGLACVKLRREKKEIIETQLQFYEEQQFPKQFGLCEMTVFVKKPKNELVQKTMNLWFDMIQKYSKRDQMSFMYAIYKTGLPIQVLQIPVKDNKWFFRETHKRPVETKNYRLYFGDSKDFELKRVHDGEYIKIGNHYSLELTIPATTQLIEFSITEQEKVLIQNLKVNQSVEDIQYFNAFYVKDVVIFDGDCCCNIIGNFEENKLLKIEFDLEKLDEEKYLYYMRYLSTENGKLNLQYQSLLNDYNKIIKSKGWKLLEKCRKIKK